ncbi:MAG: hypothetical protein D6791_07540, partial [Chloroflexi bacterium]
MIGVSFQCADVREYRRAGYVFETLFSTLGLPWHLTKDPFRGIVESEVMLADQPALIVHYGDKLPDELHAHVATGGGVIHIARASNEEQGGLSPSGERPIGAAIEETSNGFLASIDFD